MLTKSQLDHWFTYHPPTPETTPKYAAINAVFTEARNTIVAHFEAPTVPVGFEVINDAAKAFVVVIDETCPDCDDKKAAVEWVRLARHAANEARLSVCQSGGSAPWVEMEKEAEMCLFRARWKANSAIACGGV